MPVGMKLCQPKQADLLFFNFSEFQSLKLCSNFIVNLSSEFIPSENQVISVLSFSVKAFVEATQYFLGKGVQYILSHDFSQDPMEEYFGRHIIWAWEECKTIQQCTSLGEIFLIHIFKILSYMQ